MTMTIHEILVDARNRIARVGWTQHTLVNPQGNVCARGAILGCDFDHPVFGLLGTAATARGALERSFSQAREVESVVREVLAESYELPKFSLRWDDETALVHWNNDPNRTQQEVLDAFDKAIAKTAPEPHVSFVTKEEILV